ncbi:cell division protein DivIB [Clostridia bacterium]|nr:cell division protein DivIB [Clostridia bacterium]
MSYSEQVPRREQAPRRRRPPRGKRKKQHFFLNIFIVILVIAGLYLLVTSSIFDVKYFTIENNQHFTEAQIVEISGVPKGENIFTIRVSHAQERLEQDPYIRGARVQWDLPDTIAISLDERTEDVLVASGDDLLLLNYDGTILRTDAAKSALPLIVGLTPKDPAPGQPLKVAEADLLKPCFDFFQLMQLHDFPVQHLDVGNLLPRVYILDTFYIEGTLKDIENNIDELKRVVAYQLANVSDRGKISVSATGTGSFIPENSGTV